MSSRDKIVYISGSYRSEQGINGVYENIQRARAEAVNWWQKGYTVICPHTNTAFMDGAAPDNVWLEGDIAILGRCDIIVMLKGWEDSAGAKAELDYAEFCELEIIYQ